MSKVYCDTCIYINIVKGEKDKFRDLSQFALAFFTLVKEGEYILVTSDWVFKEFKKKIGDTSFIKELLDTIDKENKIHITTTKQDQREARKLCKENYPDALHVILAKKSGAIYLTTRDMDDFAEFKDYLDKNSVELTYPERL
ncbi:MAG: hypothetical protein MAG795_00054 [Candidatus Woesearchaeota archaeon]|nr:hypothetical protein [Candidatus Woesearchaeota archaeon]